MQCPIAYQGVAIHTLAGLCALWWPSAASSSGNLHKLTKPHINKPHGQPCRSPQCMPHRTCCTLQRLHLTLQCPMAHPGLATHTLTGLCALWLQSAASSSGNLHTPAKPRPPQTTCPALPQHPVQPPPHLLHSAEPAFELAVPHNMLSAGYPTLAGLCTLWLLSGASF